MEAIKRKTGLLLAVILVICMSFNIAFAEDKEEETPIAAANDPSESILLMTLGYVDDNGEYIIYKTGTCFLINDEYVLTNKHVVTLTGDELQDMREMVGKKNLKATDENICLYVYANRDMKVAATMHENVNSDVMDFAAVKLEETVSGRAPVALGSSSDVVAKDNVYAMGFPADSISAKNFNTKDDVSTVDGTVSKLTSTDTVDIIEHTAPLNVGNSGGPLLDESNNVIGVNSFTSGKKNYSIQIDAIKEGLDTFGISYVSGSGTDVKAEEETEEPDDLSIERSQLQAALDEAKSIDTESYTKESVAALNDSIGSAESVLQNTEATKEQLIGATDQLNEAITGLEEKSGPSILLIAIIVAIVIIIAVIVILLVVSRKKKTASVGPVVPPAPRGITDTAGNSTETSNQEPSRPNVPYQQPVPEGAGETSLLDAGAGETTLLNNGGGAYLIRKKNGEKIPINLQSFKIGKERRKVDYCISDNTSVSRVHCIIKKKGDDYYVIDQGSTNCTFINGIQSNANRETLLSDQSVLKLSDEEFEFHLL